MKRQFGFSQLAVLIALAILAVRAEAQVLYSQSFDADDTANWSDNPGNVDFTTGQPPPVDTDSDFFFDYSTIGIPTAPNSTGGSTRGMKLAANLTSSVFGGYTVSPIGQSFTGDYSVKADIWANYIGTFDTDGDPNTGGVAVSAAGASMLAQMGVMSPTDFSNSPGFIKGVLFSATGDGGSGADYRLYSEERTISYQIPPVTPEDSHAVYSAGSRNNTATYYLDAFDPSTVPAAQTALTAYDYNGTPKNLSETQYGSTPDGTIGMAWYRWEVRKQAGIVSWFIDGTLLGTVDVNQFATQPAGTNISFGHADINAGISNDPNYVATMFTLVDNIEVTALASEDANFDNDADVDNADLGTWTTGFGTATGGTNATGDANADGAIDGRDFLVWQRQYTGPIAGVAVPEPANWCSAVVAALVIATIAAPRRRAALQPIVR
jgi:hypothetical protein